MFQRQPQSASKNAGASSRLRLMDGQVFAGKYYALEKIGHGQKSVVYRARPQDSAHTVALKLLLPSFAIDNALARAWQKESARGGKLDHPGLVKILDFGFDVPAKLSYIVMEYVEGVPLYELMQRHGKLDKETSISLIKQIAEALDTAHQAGFIHGDLNLANIIIAKDDGDNYQASIVDFGIIQITTAVAKKAKDTKTNLPRETKTNLPRESKTNLSPRTTDDGIPDISYQHKREGATLQSDIDAVSMIMCHLLLDVSTRTQPHFETMQALIAATNDPETIKVKAPTAIIGRSRIKPGTALMIAAMLGLLILIILIALALR
ncbi:MAG: serine/threonine protein kinase [Candidatus Obscuribacter sp.]|nr:serine/threonine protein kinase [Candidatus Obscuribacter sp.]